MCERETEQERESKEREREKVEGAVAVQWNGQLPTFSFFLVFFVLGKCDQPTRFVVILSPQAKALEIAEDCMAWGDMEISTPHWQAGRWSGTRPGKKNREMEKKISGVFLSL